MNLLLLGAAGNQNIVLIVFMVLMFGGMYFLSIRPQKKQQEKRAEMLSQMKKGDAVLTIGGMKGKIDEIDMDAKEVIIDVDGVFLTFDIGAIRKVTSVANAPKVEEKTEEK